MLYWAIFPPRFAADKENSIQEDLFYNGKRKAMKAYDPQKAYKETGHLSDHKRRAKYAEQEPRPTPSDANSEIATMIADKQALEQEEAKPTAIARWESKSGKHWVTLVANGDDSYSYDAPGASGSLGMLNNDQAAIDSFSVRVATGIFQPDANKTPMYRVF